MASFWECGQDDAVFHPAHGALICALGPSRLRALGQSPDLAATGGQITHTSFSGRPFALTGCARQAHAFRVRFFRLQLLVLMSASLGSCADGAAGAGQGVGGVHCLVPGAAADAAACSPLDRCGLCPVVRRPPSVSRHHHAHPRDFPRSSSSLLPAAGPSSYCGANAAPDRGARAHPEPAGLAVL